MKKILTLLGIFLFSNASSSPSEQHWICSQVGVLKDSYMMAVGRFIDNGRDYEKKNEIFEKMVQKITNGTFEPAYSCMCRDFATEKDADTYLKRILKEIKKRDFSVLWVALKSAN